MAHFYGVRSNLSSPLPFLVFFAVFHPEYDTYVLHWY